MRIRFCLIYLFVVISSLKIHAQSNDLELGIKMIMEQRYKEAIPYFDNHLNLNPNSGVGYFQRGVCYLMINKASVALVDFNQAISIDTNLIEVYYNRALAHQALKNYTFSESDFLLFLERKPESFKTYLNLAILMEAMSDYENSILYYNQYLKYAPKDVEAMKSRAVLYSELGHLELAIEDLDKCLKILPNDTGLWLLKGHFYFDARKYSNAIDAYNVILLNHPLHISALNNRADAKFSNKDYEAALEDYKILHRQFITKAEYTFNLAFCYLQLNQNKEAVDYFNIAFQQDYSNLGLLLMFRGLAYHNMNLKIEACSDWQKAIDAGCNEAKDYKKNYCQ